MICELLLFHIFAVIIIIIQKETKKTQTWKKKKEKRVHKIEVPLFQVLGNALVQVAVRCWADRSKRGPFFYFIYLAAGGLILITYYPTLPTIRSTCLPFSRLITVGTYIIYSVQYLPGLPVLPGPPVLRDWIAHSRVST